MARRRLTENEQLRATRFAGALSEALHDLRIGHRELAAELSISRYTVDSWTRASEPKLPNEQNLAQLCRWIDERQPGLGSHLAAAAQFDWTPQGDEVSPGTAKATGTAHNLPTAVSSFVGRETELLELQHLLALTRLLTLTGVGGVGKTRLALQLAQQVEHGYRDGAWLVELAAVRDPALLGHAIGIALEIQDTSRVYTLQELSAYLHNKKVLLIFDNCEHLSVACAQACEALLHACPHLRVLATSREVLGVAGEVLYRVLPLKPPPAAMALPLADDAPRAIASFDAVRLFVERASAVQSTFELNAQNAHAVAQICRRLDGIPLALELAAARARHFPLSQIALRLDDRFRLLTTGSPAALPRQQTLRAALDWSYELLAEPERVLFRRLYVFDGGWTLAAAAVCSDPLEPGSPLKGNQSETTTSIGVRLEAEDVPDLLSRLVDKSLVVLEEREGESRYHLLETVREYAREHCTATGEADRIRASHLAYFRRFVLQIEPLLRSADQVRAFRLLDGELENVRAAMTWALAHHPQTLSEMMSNLFLYWQFWNMASEGLRWAQMAEEHTRLSTNAAADTVRARASLLRVLAELALQNGRHILASEMSEEAVALYRRLDNPPGLGIALCTRAFVAFETGQLTLARQTAAESIPLLEASGDAFDLSYVRGAWARTLAAMGEFALAEDSLKAALRDARRAGAPIALSMSLLTVAAMEIERNDLRAAQPPLDEAIQLFQATRNQHMLYVAISLRADIARNQKQYREAEALYRQVIAGWHERQQMGGLARCVEYLAFMAEAQGDTTRAVRLLGAATSVRASYHTPMTEREQAEYTGFLQQLRHELDAEMFAESWAQGKGMVDQVMPLVNMSSATSESQELVGRDK